jgi:hypothetical protein
MVAALMACVSVIAMHSRSTRLLADTDTSVLFHQIDRHSIWKWFRGDWPLSNHFYRPISTLSLALDRHLFGDNVNGYAYSAAVYCGLCVLAVFWLAREVTNSPFVAVAAAWLFAFWQSPFEFAFDQVALGIAIAAAIIGFWRHRLKAAPYLSAMVAVTFLATELSGVYRKESPGGMYGSMLVWLPSRTTSIMTLFALCAIASYARYERLGGSPKEPKPTPLDLPATRTTGPPVQSPRVNWIWAAIACVCVAMSLGSYEQAAMLPSILFLVAIILRAARYTIRWRTHAAFWSLLGAYVLLRDLLLPQGPSEYQIQELRYGLPSFLSTINYVAPGFASAYGWFNSFAIGGGIFVSAMFYSVPIQVMGNAVSYLYTFRKSCPALCMWLASCFAFLPMAFLKPFAHYHYWPMAMRSIFVALLMGFVWQLIVTAASPRASAAPLRHSPAPGSLPHR